MGNKQPGWQRRRPFSLADWEFIEASGGRGFFRNRTTGQHAEEFLLRVPENDKLAYQRRSSRCEEYLVNVLHCQVFTNFDAKYTLIDFTVRVFLEHVAVRLSEIAQLPADAIPLLLFDCLLGFKKIYEEHGPTRVNPDMIGFLENKEVRVWLSKNYLQNFHQQNGSATEAAMVEDIFSIFDKYSEEYSQRPEHMTFSQGLQLVARLRSIDKSEIKLVRVAKDASPIKPAKQPEHIIEVGSPQLHQHSKIIETASKGHRIRTEVDSGKMLRQTSKKKEAEADSRLRKDPLITVSFLQSHVHQRKLSSNDNIVSAYDEHSQIKAKEGFEKIRSQKSGLTIGLDSARTTSKNVPVYNELVEIDCRGLQLELLDDKKTKESKLRLIRDALRDERTDVPLRKICRIYDFALQHDPLMYHELQKVGGRISNINNQHVIRRLIELSEHESESERQGVVQSESQPVWKMPKKEVIPMLPTMAKQQSEERIKRILFEERKKRTMGMEYRKSDMNHTFFTGHQLKKKTTLQQRRQQFEGAPRLSELPAKHEAVNASSEASMQSPQTLKNERHDKGKIMKTFKEEVEKLLDF